MANSWEDDGGPRVAEHPAATGERLRTQDDDAEHARALVGPASVRALGSSARFILGGRRDVVPAVVEADSGAGGHELCRRAAHLILWGIYQREHLIRRARLGLAEDDRPRAGWHPCHNVRLDLYHKQSVKKRSI